MSQNKPEELNSQAVPFFARFLEGQSFEDLSDDESEAISGGYDDLTNNKDKQTFITLKAPSDRDDGPIATRKYPSDNDELA